MGVKQNFLLAFIFIFLSGCAFLRSSGVSTNTSGLRTPANVMDMKFASIPAGEFTMGSPENEKHRDMNEEQVKVKLTQGFEMQMTEVTQLQWFGVMGTNPSRFKNEGDCKGEHRVIEGISLCPNHPVERVSWYEVQDFIAKYNQQTNDGYIYRLPTEAEWEYATRAGTTTAYFFGNDFSKLSNYGWFWGNSEDKRTHPVGRKGVNPWGPYDMYGNVWEWVQDHYKGELPGGNNPLQSDGRSRVVRGGSWCDGAFYLRSAVRSYDDPGGKNYDVGFRLVRIPAKR